MALSDEQPEEVMTELVEQLKTLRIQTMLKDPSYWKNGERFFDPALAGWKDIEVRDANQCEHLETLCADCAMTWLIDYWVRVVHEQCGRVIGINGVPGIDNLGDL